MKFYRNVNLIVILNILVYRQRVNTTFVNSHVPKDLMKL